MNWDSYEEESHQEKSYFNFLYTHWGCYQVDITPEGQIYIPTIGVWSKEGKDQLFSSIKQKVREVDKSAQMYFNSKLSVFVIEMKNLESAKSMIELVKEVVEDYVKAKK